MDDAPVGIGFDLDHTLIFDNKLERVALLRLLELVLEDGGRIRGTLADEVDSIDELLELQRGGAFSIDEAVRRFVRERGVPSEERYVERFRTMAVEMVEEFVIPFPGAKRTFAVLRERGCALAVLSNGWNPLQIRKAQRTGFEGPVIASADIGAQKPKARAFEVLLDVLGTHPQNAWYVGDDPRGDIAGARDAGMQTVWINVEKKAYPGALLPPTHTIHSLEELLAIVPAPAQVS